MFLTIGGVGLALLLLAIIFDDLLDGLVPETGGWLSMSGLAAFLAAFGFGAWLLDSSTRAPTVVAAGGGVVAGLGLAYLAIRLSRGLSTMATDATPTAADLVGREGKVVTPIPAGSTGEALVRLGGQPLKLVAVAGADQSTELAIGAAVVVVRVISPTRVEVQAAEPFWGRPGEPGPDSAR